MNDSDDDNMWENDYNDGWDPDYKSGNAGF